MLNFLKNRGSLIYWSIFLFVLLILTLKQYYAPIHYHYLVPPGGDPYNHYQMAQSLFDGSTTFLKAITSGGYPPLFHYLLAEGSKLFHKDIVSVMIAVYPSILILTSLATFFLAYAAFGRMPALFSLVLYVFIARTPGWLLNDGGYPDLIAASVFLPCAVAFFILFVRKKNYLFLASSIIFSLLVVLTHHVSTFYLLALLIFSTFFIIFFLWRIKNWSFKKLIFWIMVYLVFFVGLFLLFRFTDLLAPAKQLSALVFDFTNSFPYIKVIPRAVRQNEIWDLKDYGANIGKIVYYLGLVGLIYSFVALRKNMRQYFIPLVVLSVWVIFLIIGSQITFIANAERMARDLALPLTIWAGFFIYDFYTKITDRKVANLLIVMFAAIFIIPPAYTYARSYNGFNNMVTITEADMQIANDLDKKTPAAVLTNYSNLWLWYTLPNKSIETSWDFENLKTDYDYIYLVKQQAGWSPEPINFDLDEKIDGSKYELTDRAKSGANEIWLYKLK